MCGGGTAYDVEVPEEHSHGAHAQLAIAREVFPELASVPSWPSLWVPSLWVPGWTLPAEAWTWTATGDWTSDTDLGTMDDDYDAMDTTTTEATMDTQAPHYFGEMKAVTDKATGTLECGHSFPGRRITGKRARCPLCSVAWRRANIGPEAPDYWSEVFDGVRPFNHTEVAR
jgi:hypothetical protein